MEIMFFGLSHIRNGQLLPLILTIIICKCQGRRNERKSKSLLNSSWINVSCCLHFYKFMSLNLKVCFKKRIKIQRFFFFPFLGEKDKHTGNKLKKILAKIASIGKIKLRKLSTESSTVDMSRPESQTIGGVPKNKCRHSVVKRRPRLSARLPVCVCGCLGPFVRASVCACMCVFAELRFISVG